MLSAHVGSNLERTTTPQDSRTTIPYRPTLIRSRAVQRSMDLPPDLDALRAFHGHLGVYVTLGLRMGAIGRRHLGHYKGLTAAVRADAKPPMRCVLDGVQFSSGCTIGKGNISFRPGSNPEVVFAKEGQTLRVALRPGWREKIDAEMSKEHEVEQSLLYYSLDEDRLFAVTGPGPSTSRPRRRRAKTPGSRGTAARRRRRS